MAFKFRSCFIWFGRRINQKKRCSHTPCNEHRPILYSCLYLLQLAANLSEPLVPQIRKERIFSGYQQLPGNEWKLTLKDKDRKFACDGANAPMYAFPGGEVGSYRDAVSGDKEFVSPFYATAQALPCIMSVPRSGCFQNSGQPVHWAFMP